MKTVQGIVGQPLCTVTTYSDNYEDMRAEAHLSQKVGLSGCDLTKGKVNSARNASRRRLAAQGAEETKYFPIASDE